MEKELIKKLDVIIVDISDRIDFELRNARKPMDELDLLKILLDVLSVRIKLETSEEDNKNGKGRENERNDYLRRTAGTAKL